MNDATIVFEGITRGSELLGATQASFSVDRPRRHAKETSVLLNDPAAAYLASESGLPNDDAFKAHIVQGIGYRRRRQRLERFENFIIDSHALTLASVAD